MLEAELQRRRHRLEQLHAEHRRLEKGQTWIGALQSSFRGVLMALTGFFGWWVESVPWFPLLILPFMALKFCLFSDGPPEHRIEAMGSVLVSEGDAAPALGVSCLFTATRPGRGEREVDCEIHITCGDWFHRDVYACRENGYEVSSGEGDTTTEYYLTARSREPGVDFRLHEQERVVFFSSESASESESESVTWRLALHTLEADPP